MTADDGWDRRGTTRVSGLRRLGATLRSLLLGAVVFVLAVLTGALLAGAAPAGPATPADGGGAGAAENSEARTSEARDADSDAASPPLDVTFARSMVYSGGVALLLSVAGLVMVGRRRRLW